jgi:hypothetical protein
MEEKEASLPEFNTFSSEHRLTDEDKEDIFEFIFLDVCIELYQEAIEKENEAEGASPAAIRILNSIKSFIQQQKKRKSERENRKIGICTNVHTVK